MQNGGGSGVQGTGHTMAFELFNCVFQAYLVYKYRGKEHTTQGGGGSEVQGKGHTMASELFNCVFQAYLVYKYRGKEHTTQGGGAVSYTHLTLPTKLSV